MLGIFGGVDLTRLVEPALHLCCQLAFGFDPALVAHRLVLGRVGTQLGAIHRNVAEADQASLLAECQHLSKQVTQRLQVTATKLADGAEVRPVQRRDRLEIQPLLAATRDPPRGVDTLAVSIERSNATIMPGSYGGKPRASV